MTPDEIRESFLKYFEERGHTRCASASLVPENDPSLLFTGAGMNQFKDEFLGQGRRGLSRACSSQKCLRTGDLENVGRTAGHQSFFEMLGNFSFGDYFKREAIEWAWDYLTTTVNLDPERLHVTVYEEDNEAYEIWRDVVGIAESRIYRFDAKSNFWPANAPADGPNGPCGPCSEIFFDFGPNDRCLDPEKCDPECDCRRYEEIWNLVFTQFDRRDGGELVPLPQKNIDTGMGFERLIRVLEGVPTNVETSLFLPILNAVATAAGREAYQPDGEEGVRMRRIADHVRASCFLVGDGVRPGNEGRGYVLRRVLRRAIRDGAGLGIQDPFLASLVPSVAVAMGHAYSELVEGVELLASVLNAEEMQFRRTFANGMRRLETAIDEALADGAKELEGAIVFQLHDTFGFPVDVTAEILSERGLGFDRERHDELMREQRERSRAAQKMSDEIFERGPVGELAERGARETVFVGYDDPEREAEAERGGVAARARIDGIVLEKDGKLHDEVRDGEKAILVLDRTPFYSEAGGQTSDTGEIVGAEGVFRVADVSASEGFYLHTGTYRGEAPLRTGAQVGARVDRERRDAIRRNHTATHLLHRALKDLLGETCQQAGSLVMPDRLRFDFTLDRGLTADEIRELEDAVNRQVLLNTTLDTELLGVEDAKRSGAVALFGEKYPDPVRVVSVGGYSKELCGGTHCRSAGDIGLFRITSESSIAAGIRRVEAVTGMESVRRMQDERGVLGGLARQLGVPPHEVGTRVEKLAKDIRELRKRAAAAVPSFDALTGTAVDAGGVRIFVHLVQQPRAALTKAADAVKKDAGDPAGALIISEHDGKIAAVCVLNGAAVEAGVDAVALLRGAGGRGGGRPLLAQGTFPGSPTVDSLRAAVEAALAPG